MKTLFRLVLSVAAGILVLIGLATLGLEVALLANWNIWPKVGPIIWAIAHADGAKWFLPVIGIFLIRAGLFFFNLQGDLA